MKQISLNGKHGSGKMAFVSDCDYPILYKFEWYPDSKGYIYRAKSRGKRIFMHQFIMGDYPKGKTEIDHINGIKWDNQRQNLRFCTSSENHINRTKYRTNKSGYKGVQWHPQGKKWLARYYLNKQPFYLGLFKTAKEAYKAIEKAKS